MVSSSPLSASVWILTRPLNRKYALFTTLGLRRTQMESPVQLSIFPGLPRSSCEHICQMFFERFNVAGFSILERPMAQMYACNALNGLVIDLGYHWTDISAVYDGSHIAPSETFLCAELEIMVRKSCSHPHSPIR